MIKKEVKGNNKKQRKFGLLIRGSQVQVLKGEHSKKALHFAGLFLCPSVSYASCIFSYIYHMKTLLVF
jgi:hypothetical protein